MPTLFTYQELVNKIFNALKALCRVSRKLQVGKVTEFAAKLWPN